jgi:MerR family transcriptional regulator, copper efflux regulator
MRNGGGAMAATMTVGQAAEAAGITRKAVRLYEQRGLLPLAQRTAAGYRLYDQDDVDILTFIRRARALNLTLDEINDILDRQRGGAQPCDRVTQLLDAHLDQINRTLAELHQLRRDLLAARRTADQTRRAGSGAVVCQIMETSTEPNQHSTRR